MNSLFKLFDVEPEQSIVVEFPSGSGIRYIPIEEVKKMLWGDFAWWGTENFKFNIYLVGHSTFVSGSCELVLVHKEFGKFGFVGAYTYDLKKDVPEPEINENLEATVLSECIKNASKNIGRKYGMFLNTKRIENRLKLSSEAKAVKPKESYASEAIDNFLKTTKK